MEGHPEPPFLRPDRPSGLREKFRIFLGKIRIILGKTGIIRGYLPGAGWGDREAPPTVAQGEGSSSSLPLFFPFSHFLGPFFPQIPGPGGVRMQGVGAHYLSHAVGAFSLTSRPGKARLG